MKETSISITKEVKWCNTLCVSINFTNLDAKSLNSKQNHQYFTNTFDQFLINLIDKYPKTIMYQLIPYLDGSFNEKLFFILQAEIIYARLRLDIKGKMIVSPTECENMNQIYKSIEKLTKNTDVQQEEINIEKLSILILNLPNLNTFFNEEITEENLLNICSNFKNLKEIVDNLS